MPNGDADENSRKKILFTKKKNNNNNNKTRLCFCFFPPKVLVAMQFTAKTRGCLKCEISPRRTFKGSSDQHQEDRDHECR